MKAEELIRVVEQLIADGNTEDWQLVRSDALRAAWIEKQALLDAIDPNRVQMREWIASGVRDGI